MYKEIIYNVNENGCWICISHRIGTSGYPICQINGKQVGIHRRFYEEYKGPIPNNTIVRHTCDNKLCINPEHLILGSHLDNVKDRVLRNRSAIGENNGRSKLTEHQVFEIKYNSSQYKNVELSKRYNVSPKTISNIKNNISWKFV